MKNTTPSNRHSHGEREGTSRPHGLSAFQAINCAQRVFKELTGAVAEAVSSVERTRDGWCVVIDIVELERIPATTDIIASYAVNLDPEGELLGYSRINRHFRSDVRGAS